MKDVRFYVTIEVTAQMTGDYAEGKKREDVRRRIVQYIHNEKQRENHVNAGCYLHGEYIMSINDEKGNEL